MLQRGFSEYLKVWICSICKKSSDFLAYEFMLCTDADLIFNFCLFLLFLKFVKFIAIKVFNNANVNYYSKDNYKTDYIPIVVL